MPVGASEVLGPTGVHTSRFHVRISIRKPIDYQQQKMPELGFMNPVEGGCLGVAEREAIFQNLQAPNPPEKRSKA